MHIDLDEWRVSNAVKAVDLAGLDHENVAGSGPETLLDQWCDRSASHVEDRVGGGRLLLE